MCIAVEYRQQITVTFVIKINCDIYQQYFASLSLVIWAAAATIYPSPHPSRCAHSVGLSLWRSEASRPHSVLTPETSALSAEFDSASASVSARARLVARPPVLVSDSAASSAARAYLFGEHALPLPFDERALRHEDRSNHRPA